MLFGDVAEGVQSLHRPSCLRATTQRANGLLALKLLTLKTGRAQCSKRGVERRLGPVAVLGVVDAGVVAVAGVGLPEKLIEIAERICQRLAALNDRREGIHVVQDRTEGMGRE